MNTKLRQFFIFLSGWSQHRTDQFTKHLAVVHLKGQKPVVLIKGVFEFYYSENRGVAFGTCRDGRDFSSRLQRQSFWRCWWGGLPDAGRETVSAVTCSLFRSYQEVLAI